MAQKKKTTKQKTTTDVKESAHRVWLAGLGALAAAEEEGGKMFRSLVERGKAYESRVTDPVKKAEKNVRGTVSKARQRAGRTMDDLETAWDERLTGALKRLGLPTRSEINDLRTRVEKLTAALDGKASTTKKTTKKKATKKKATKKKSAAKKRTTTKKTTSR